MIHEGFYLIDYHDLHRVVLPDHRSRPPQMPDIAWNPWTDLRERYDVQKLNLTFPYEQMPGKVQILSVFCMPQRIIAGMFLNRMLRALIGDSAYNSIQNSSMP